MQKIFFLGKMWYDFFIMIINQGDKIGIIALAGNCEEFAVEKAKKNIELLGYQTELSKNIYKSDRYLAGEDCLKVNELHRFFADLDIKLILNSRGGYGAIRLLDDIDYNLIKNNPKPFCGFSDITFLLLMIYKKSGIITYHSPMACSDFAKDEINEFTLENFKKALSGAKLIFNGSKLYNSGSSRGIIWGGNLSSVVSLCGLDFIPDNDFIFFAEDLNEPVYKIDRMFHQLFNIKEFKSKCKGLVLGDFLNNDDNLWLEDLFFELSHKYNLPAVCGFKITHSEEKITVPIGRMAELVGTQLVIS